MHLKIISYLFLVQFFRIFRFSFSFSALKCLLKILQKFFSTSWFRAVDKNGRIFFPRKIKFSLLWAELSLSLWAELGRSVRWREKSAACCGAFKLKFASLCFSRCTRSRGQWARAPGAPRPRAQPEKRRSARRLAERRPRSTNSAIERKVVARLVTAQSSAASGAIDSTARGGDSHFSER